MHSRRTVLPSAVLSLQSLDDSLFLRYAGDSIEAAARPNLVEPEDRPLHFAYPLRCELSNLAKKYADARSLPHSVSYGETPIVCFEAGDDFLHGNFLAASYLAILANPEWRRRFRKVHTQARRSLPPTQYERRRELDTCVSSDALLMNVFCFPRLLTNARVARLLGLDTSARPRFGVPARVPLNSGLCDRTEVDMAIGDLLVEAKLTEGDFQRAGITKLLQYRDFKEVFDQDQLPRRGSYISSYQLIRNVLAAHARGCTMRVLLDARRPDLLEAFYKVISCVRPVPTRTSCGVLTWQELSQVLPPKLQAFLAEKYGIE